MDVVVASPPGSVGLSDAAAPALGSGTSAVVTPNGLTLEVQDLDPGVASSAVRISASGSGGPMSIVPCGLAMTLSLDAGDSITIDCGSVAIAVGAGNGITASAGTAAVVIPMGAAATLDLAGGALVVRDVAGGAVQVTVGGVTSSVAPGSGQTSFLAGHDFVGFQQPVDAYPVVNVAKAGSAIPLKWRVVDSAGTPVANVASASIATKLSGACTGSASGDDIEQYVAANQSSLQNLGDGYYQYNWKTNKTWAGSCRQIVLAVDSAIVLDANPVFRFK
jgi:hypothetical protein